MKWDGRERERGEGKRGGSEESEFAQAPDSRGSQLLKRTKLVRLFFQQGENIAIQKLDARVFQSHLCNNLWPLRRMEDSILSATLLPSPLVSVSLGSKFASVLRVLPTRPRRELSSSQIILQHGLHFCASDLSLSLFHFWQVQDDLLFVLPQSPHPALRRSEEER